MEQIEGCTICYPICPSCAAETDHDGDDFYCYPCGLAWNGSNPEGPGFYLDPEATACGKPGRASKVPNRVIARTVHRYVISPCLLPQGRRTPRHTPVPLGTGSMQLTPEQQAKLARHAAARNCSLPEALDALLSSPPPRRPWTPQELALLRNPRNHPRDIARATHRTATAVSNRRYLLAREENILALQRPRKVEEDA